MTVRLRRDRGALRLLRPLGIWLLLVQPAGSVTGQDIVINEVMSSNRETLVDRDGDTPDWIEIYNRGTASVDLEGYGLADGDDPHQWVFPPATLAPGDRLLVFASGKDRREGAAHWETVIDWGDEWRYIVPASEPDPAWRRAEYDDASWGLGPTGIGFGDGDDRTEVPRPATSIYARKTFHVENLELITTAFLDVDFDDGFVAYLNGREIARENMEDLGRPPAFTEFADRSTEPRLDGGERPFHYAIEDFRSLLRRGDNVLAVQVHNASARSSDMSLIPFLTFGMVSRPAAARGLAEAVAPNLPELHTNFRISSGGESISLSAADGTLLDVVDTGSPPTDVSLGRFPDGGDEFSFHVEPTPGAPNTSRGFGSISGLPEFSHDGGFYLEPITLTLSTDDRSGTLYYTLDGSVPTVDSPRYTGPIVLDETAVVRATVLGDDALSRAAVTHTFLIDESLHLPVVSISTDPENFFDPDIGIYVRGRTSEAAFPHFGANFWEDWERPVHLELFEADGTLGLSQDAGTKIFGGWSRGHPQRSLSFFARREYGSGEFRYRIFPEKKIDRFESFILRNSGNDWQRTHFRDALMTSLVEDLGIDRQAYRPAILFINGEYYGIMNLREKINEHFIESNHEGVDAERIDLLEGNSQVLEGSASHYRAMISLVERSDVGDPAVYEQVKSMMDVENFIDYQASQIYFDNTDWPGNNIKFWRPQTDEGRWRWILFDTDFGFGIWNVNNYANNTLAFALAPNGPSWPNPPWSTLLLRRLIANGEFVEDFVNRFATHLDTVFEAGRVIARIGEMEDALESDMARQRRRWGGSVSEWRSHVNTMRTFASRRATYMRRHLTSIFGLGSSTRLALEVSPPGSGAIEVQGLEIRESPWTGSYFQGLPIRLAAKPRPGFRFVRWAGVEALGEASATLLLSTTSHDVSARFEVDCAAAGDVVINEINYNAPQGADPGDWVELHNPTLGAIDLSGWTLQDGSDGHVFTLPGGTVLRDRSYLVLCSDVAAFTARYPGVDSYVGDLGFSLAGDGERVRLRDHAGNEVDSVTYGDESPWPEEADGLGATLALRNPLLENSYAPHWSPSRSGGTPGARNDVFEEVESNCGEGGMRFLRGDCNDDAVVDISDARCVLTWLFAGRALTCLAAADPNGDSTINVADASYLLSYLFQGGPPPVEPFVACGPAGEGDALGCESAPFHCR